jgi:LysR family hydrogen peroxide-inducible transcriptional activator
VSQPTLSVAIKKLEEELDVKLFERSANEVSATSLGAEIIRHAQLVLEQAAEIKEIAKRGKDPLAGTLRLGVIYTIGPYLLPDLMRQIMKKAPQMPLMLQENFTVKLMEMLRAGEIDCAILAEPFPDVGLATAALYDEPFMAALPVKHLLAKKKSITAEQLKNETMLLLGNGHCFRDHVLEVCPEFARFSSDCRCLRKPWLKPPREKNTKTPTLLICLSWMKQGACHPHAVWSWFGAKALRATRPLPHFATLFMRVNYLA